MKIEGLFPKESEYKQKMAEVLKEEEEIKQKLNSDRISYWGLIITKTFISSVDNSIRSFSKPLGFPILASGS